MDMQILMIDDHSSILTGYNSILSHNNLGHKIVLTTATCCESAFNTINNAVVIFDLVILDYSLPPFNKQKIYSGNDLIPHIKNKFPDT